MKPTQTIDKRACANGCGRWFQTSSRPYCLCCARALGILPQRSRNADQMSLKEMQDFYKRESMTIPTGRSR